MQKWIFVNGYWIQCKNDAELQRVGKELLMTQERNLIELLKFLKYFVDTMRKNNVVMGLGRGSSVASSQFIN